MSIIIKQDKGEFSNMKPGSIVKILVNIHDNEGITLNSYVMRVKEHDSDNSNLGITIMSEVESELGSYWGGLYGCDYEIIKIV